MNRAEQVKTMKDEGLSIKEITEILGLSESRIRYLNDPLRKEKRKTYRNRYNRKHWISTPNGRMRAEKRARPDTCELCSKAVARLDYHHWDNEQPHLGLWLCISCHIFAGRVDNDMVNKYLDLKGSIR